MSVVKYHDGIEFEDQNGKSWVFPVLTIGFVEANMRRLWTADWVHDPELILDVLYASLKRNYEIQREQIAECFAFREAEAIAQVIIQESCLPIRSDEGKVLNLKELNELLSKRSQTSGLSMPAWLRKQVGNSTTSEIR